MWASEARKHLAHPSLCDRQPSPAGVFFWNFLESRHCPQESQHHLPLLGQGRCTVTQEEGL